MRFLKQFENINNEVWILKFENVFESPNSFTSFIDVFSSEEDLDNYVIIYCNDVQDNLILNEDYENIDNYILDNYENCLEFIEYLSPDDEYGHEIRKSKMIINSNIQLDDDLKAKLNSKKFNL